MEKKRGLVKYKYFANIARNAAEKSERVRDTALFDERQEALTREYDREYEKYMSSQYPESQYPESNYPESEFPGRKDYESNYPESEYQGRGRKDYEDSEYGNEKGYYDDDYYEPSEYYQDDYSQQDNTTRTKTRRSLQPKSKRQEPFSKNLQSTTSKKNPES